METLLYIIVAAVVSVLASVLAFRITTLHPEARIKAGALIIWGGAIWLLASALEMSSSNLATKLIFYRLHFVGVQIIPTSWLILAMLISGHEKWVNRKTIIALAIVPSTMILLVSTNEFHNLIWTNFMLNAVDPLLSPSVTEGVGYWLIEIGYSYVILLVACIIFVRKIHMSSRLYRVQAIPMLLVASFPWMLNGIYNYDVGLFMFIDLTPLALTIASVIFLWRLTYLPRIDVVPVAHEIIIDRLNEAIIILDAQGRIVEMNPCAQDLVGHKLPDAFGKPMQEVWTEWSRLRRELDSTVGKTRETAFGNRDRRRIYELQSSAIEGLTSNVPNLLITLRDITELRESQRMAAIGETAAMVGHDLRNPLQGIVGALEIIRRNLGSAADSVTVEMLDLIETSVGYAGNIVKDLMDYSTEVRLEPTETAPKSVTEVALLQFKIPENVTVRDLTQTTPRILVDLPKMQRVFVNLLRNAIEAMPQGGQITLSSSESNGILEMKVTDSGEGISDSILQNLWKPFKTTKPKGTGLGLAISKRIVEAHGGTIQVVSILGRGSAFTITIPIGRTANKPQPKLETAITSAHT